MMKTRNIDKPIRLAFASVLLLCLASCGGAPALETHELEIRIEATSDVNPDIDSRPSPVILHVLELSAVDEFNKADYFALTKNDAAALGGDVLNKTEIILTPTSLKQMPLKLNEKAAYIGFVAGYRDIDNSTWRVSQEVIPGKTDWISVTVGKQQISINEVND
jgi:type VI secretion system protein VasD